MKVLFLLFSVFLSGCATIYNIPTSEYRPMISSMDDYKKLQEKRKSNQDQLVADDLGEYYWRFYKNNTFMGGMFIPKKYSYAKKMLVDEKGVMEPVYFVDEKNNLIYDEKLTSKLYQKLSTHFNLLPLSVTKQYHVQMIEYMELRMKAHKEQLKNASKTAGFGYTLDVVNSTFSGENQVVNSQFYKSVLSKLPKHSYFIQTSFDILSIYDASPTWRNPYSGLDKYYKLLLDRGLTLNIYPVQALKNLTTSGYNKSMLSISFINTEKDNAFQERLYSGGYYRSNNAQSFKDYLRNDYRKSQAEYINGMGSYVKDLKTKMKLITGIKSQKL